MRFALDDDREALRSTARELLTELCPASAVRAAWTGVPDEAAWNALADIGALAVLVPESDGGLGLDSGLLIEGGSAEFLVAWEPEVTGSRGTDGEERRSRLRILLEREDTAMEVVGGEVEESRPLPSGRMSVRLLLDPPVARHRMWWSRGSVDLFQLGLTLDGGEDPTSHRVLRIGSVP